MNQSLKWLEEKKAGPSHVQIELTSKCSNYCSFCPHSKISRRTNLPQNLFFKIVRDLKEVGTATRITLNWVGESTNVDLSYKSKFLKKHLPGVELEIFTTLSGPKFEPKTLVSNFDLVHLLFAGHDQESTKVMTNLNFEKQVERLQRLFDCRNEFGSETEIAAHVINSNILRFDLLRKRIEKSCDRVGVSAFQTFWDLADASQSLEEYKDSSPYDCLFPFYQFAIASTGEVVLCCFDANLANSIGSVRLDSIKDLWQSPAADRVRIDMLERNERETLCTKCFKNRYLEPHKLDLSIFKENLWHSKSSQ